MNSTKPGPAHDNRCDVNHPNEGNDQQGHHNPDCAPQVTTPVPTTTDTPETPTTEHQTPVNVPEVSTPVVIERQDTNHAAVPETHTPTTTAEVAVPAATPAGTAGTLPMTGAGLGLVPLALALVIGGVRLSRFTRNALRG